MKINAVNDHGEVAKMRTYEVWCNVGGGWRLVWRGQAQDANVAALAHVPSTATEYEVRTIGGAL